MAEASYNNVDGKHYLPTIPFSMPRHLEFISFSEDGHVLLGASNLVLRCWNGSIWYYSDADLAPEKENAITGIGCETAVSCGKFLKNREQVITAEDSGTINVYGIQTYDAEKVSFVCQMSIGIHEGWISSLSTTTSKDRTVTGGSDTTINILDNESMSTEMAYMMAHSDTITSIECNVEEDIFASASLDKSTFLWDRRQSKPASPLYYSKTSGLTSLSWKSEYELGISSQCGGVVIVDIRTKKKIAEAQINLQPIHKISFNKDGLLAYCSDTNAVKIWDSNTNEVKYENKFHTGIVRGLAWHPLTNKLYSCGFDKNVFCHEIS